MGTSNMTNSIGIIAEDVSDVEVIVEILEKYIARNTFSVKKFTGDGCGKLRSKCETWTSILFKSGCTHVFIFHDLDRNDEISLRKTLEKKVSPTKYPNSLVVIPVEELEAWLLSDAAAIQKTFSLPKVPREIHDCEAVSSPKEHLEEIVWSIGKKRYLNTIHNKKISKIMSLSSLRKCRSFKDFDAYITKNICPP
ncbi:MAG: DUF4276 family protein [Pseudomonadota bacterium]